MTGKIIKVVFVLAGLSVLLWAGWKAVKLSGITDDKRDQFYQNAYVQIGKLLPEQQTINSGPLSEGFALNRQGEYAYFSQLNKPQYVLQDSLSRTATRLLNTMQGLDFEDDSASHLVSYSLQQLRNAEVPYPLYDLLSIPNGELYQTPLRLCYAHEIPNPILAEAYLSRIRQLGPKAENWTKEVKRLSEAGLLRNNAALLAASTYCKRFASIPANKHPLYLSFARRMARKGDIRVDQNDAIKLLDRISSLLEGRVLPAWQKLGESLELAAQNATPLSGAATLEAGVRQEGVLSFDVGKSAAIQQKLSTEIAQLRIDLQTAIAELETSDEVAFYPKKQAPSSLNSWRDSLQWLMDDLKIKSAGAFPDLPEFTQFEIRIQDSLMEVLNQPVWYLPGDLFGSRKAILFVHPVALGAARGSARETLIRWGIPGLHSALNKHRDSTGKPLIARGIRIRAWEQGWQLYAAKVADEIGLNLDPNSRTPAPAYGKVLYYQQQLAACELALAEITHFTTDTSTATGFLSDVKLTSGAAYKQALSRPGMHLAAWLYFDAIRTKRAEAEAKAGNLFYVGDFHSKLLDEGAFLVE